MSNDLNQLARINELLGVLQNEAPHAMDELRFKPVDVLLVEPSIDFDQIAAEHVRDLPRSLRIAMGAIGARKSSGGGNLASYILFHKNYCNELIACGYKDAMAVKEDIVHFFADEEFRVHAALGALA
jgi:NTE family protein